MFRSIQEIGEVFIFANDAPAMRSRYSTVFGLVADDPDSETINIVHRYLNQKDTKIKESFSRAIIPAKEKLEIGSQRCFISFRVSNMNKFTKHLDEIGIEYMEVTSCPEDRFTSVNGPGNNRLGIREPSEKFLTRE